MTTTSTDCSLRMIIFTFMYGTAQMQLHTCEGNTHNCERIFMQVIKPNYSSQENSFENLLSLLSIHFFLSNSTLFEDFVE